MGTYCDSSTELDPGIYESIASHRSHLGFAHSSGGEREMEGEEFECSFNLIRKSLPSVSSVSGTRLDAVFHGRVREN